MSTAPAPARPPWLAGIRLVALDLDGTILMDGAIPVGIVEALHRLRDLGVAVTTNSGRPLDFQLDLIGRYGLDTDATVTALITDERHVHVATTRPGGAPEFLPLPGWNDTVDERWRRLLPAALRWTEEALAEAERRGWAARWHLDGEEAGLRGMTALALPEPEMAELLDRWLGPRLVGTELATTVNVRLLQVLDATTGKGAVLARLADAWGVAPTAVLAVGDSHNDRSMLDGSGSFRSATPADSPEAIRSAVLDNHGIVAARPGVAGTQEVLESLAAALETLGCGQRDSSSSGCG